MMYESGGFRPTLISALFMYFVISSNRDPTPDVVMSTLYDADNALEGMLNPLSIGFELGEQRKTANALTQLGDVIADCRAGAWHGAKYGGGSAHQHGGAATNHFGRALHRDASVNFDNDIGMTVELGPHVLDLLHDRWPEL